jgi:HPt (histidine-containing phosphotransfer) domain-containing protein
MMPEPLNEEDDRETDSGPVFDTVRLHSLLRMFKKTGKDLVPAVIEPYLKNVELNIPALYAAVEDNNYSGLYKTAHFLLGGSRNLGLRTLSEICSALQDNSARNNQDNARELILALERELPLIKTHVNELREKGLL